ncbi:hypothetical protein [Trichormus variabilis]|uniref:Uncharacterized protein n=1 Tax=Trichormus variabilis SAG 1403-4b TaxID=447716 RepID=A0A3S5K2U2_ANAVA|nr:hypothetical protein [Trichormus variabilis]MBD2628845.1 hypothetical protein [Trichormus variabilis FACHB-164]RUS93770.1 hypothetical protein DSM107003_42710 [Trichormus variabilis SAG 1403-4b]
MSFRDLRRYESQKAAYDNYKAWQALSPDAKQAAFAAITDETKRAKPERELGYLSPFNQTGTLLKYLYLPVMKKTQDGQGSAIGVSLAGILDPFYIDSTGTAPGGGSIEYKAFKAAKLSLTQRSSFVKKASRITKRSYLKPDVDTYTAPFGQSVAGQSYGAALVIIQPDIDTWKEAAASGTKRSFKLTPQGA